MTEGLADDQLHPAHRHETLYGRWSDGGAGLLITGNVMIDHRGLERPVNVAIDPAPDFSCRSAVAALRHLAADGVFGGADTASDGPAMRESTRKREAYFLDYAQTIREVCDCPLMVTGGFRTRTFIEEAIAMKTTSSLPSEGFSRQHAR